MWNNTIFEAKLFSKTVYYFFNGLLLLLFRLRGKSRFSPKMFYNINSRREREREREREVIEKMNEWSGKKFLWIWTSKRQIISCLTKSTSVRAVGFNHRDSRRNKYPEMASNHFRIIIAMSRCIIFKSVPISYWLYNQLTFIFIANRWC